MKRIRRSRVDRALDDIDIAKDDPRLSILNYISDYVLTHPNFHDVDFIEDIHKDLNEKGRITAEQYKVLHRIYIKVRDVRY